MARKPYLPNRHGDGSMSHDEAERFLSGQWTKLRSEWPTFARWLPNNNVLEILFRDGHLEPYACDRPLALSFAFAPSKGGWIWDQGLAGKKGSIFSH